MKRLRIAEWAVLVGAAGLLVTLFLDWYGVECGYLIDQLLREPAIELLEQSGRGGLSVVFFDPRLDSSGWVNRKRHAPAGTVGGRMAGAKWPAARRVADSASAAASSPTTNGIIAVRPCGMLQPWACNCLRKALASSTNRAGNSG